MKLLTTGGLLYSTARAQNADATYGTYQDLDYVATFVEDQNEKYVTGGYIRVGWDPVVSEVVSAYDGGKVIFGFGKTAAYLQAGWIIKMWGTQGGGGQACANDSVITGYVNMVTGLNSELTATTQCNLTSDAKVQWAFTSIVAAGYTAGTDDYSVVVLGGVEEAFCGGTSTACETGTTYSKPSYWGVGGAMGWLQVKIKGMASWQLHIMVCNGQGVIWGTATGTGINETTGNAPINDQAIAITGSDTANQVYGDKDDAVFGAQTFTGGFTTNQCLTQVQPFLETANGDGDDEASFEARVFVWGFTASPSTCLDHAADGFTVFGHPFAYKIDNQADETKVGRGLAGTTTYAFLHTDYIAVYPFAVAAANTSKGDLATGSSTFINSSVTNTSLVNIGQIRHVFQIVSDGAQSMCAIMTSTEYYFQSVMFCTVAAADETALATITPGGADAANDWSADAYGSIWSAWPFLATNSTASNYIQKQVPDHLMIVGTRQGTGVVGRLDMTGSTGASIIEATSTLTTATSTYSTYAAKTASATNLLYFHPPTNGMAQFKGLTASTDQKKYVQVICLGVAPVYATWATSSADLGFIVNCYTGIPQCGVSLVDGFTGLNTSQTDYTQTNNCMKDPRYLTWRSYIFKMQHAGTVDWFRVDSYWNSAGKAAASTWGPGIILSTWWQWTNTVGDDNVASTSFGKTFVFAYADGSGVQLNHVATGTTPHASNTTAGAGTNTLTTAPTGYTNNLPGFPQSYIENLCLGSDLALTGTTDTSGLDSTITAYSDGYKAKISLTLEQILPGAAGGWAGVCLVYYSSEYVQDNTNGSVCFVAGVNSGTGAGPRDFGGGYLLEVGSAAWKPPARSGAVTIATGALSGGKYGITKSPSAATARMFTSAFYASAEWYQPKYASSYNGIARYGKDDYVGAYCMQGSGSTSYFSAPGGSAKLTGAVSLAASVLALGTAITLAM